MHTELKTERVLERGSRFLLNVFLIPASLIITCHCLSASEAESLFLVDKHQKAGITCDGCHKEKPPQEVVFSEVCIACHGDYSKLTERTAKVIPNPHDSHMGDLDCKQCHRLHQKSVSACSPCHTFSFKVP